MDGKIKIKGTQKVEPLQNTEQNQSIQRNDGKIRLGTTSRFRRKNEPAFPLPEKKEEKTTGPTLMGMQYETSLKVAVSLHVIEGIILLILGMRLYSARPSSEDAGFVSQTSTTCVGNLWLGFLLVGLLCFVTGLMILIGIYFPFKEGRYGEAGKLAKKLSIPGALLGLVISGMILSLFQMSVAELEAERRHATEQTLEHMSLSEIQERR